MKQQKRVSMMMLYILYAVSVLMVVKGSTLISQQVEYKAIDKAPDPLSRIGPSRTAKFIEMRLIRCLKASNCKSTVYEDSMCHLQNASDGSSSKYTKTF